MYLSWRGPSEGLLSVLRAAALGAHKPRAGAETTVVSDEESADVVADEVSMAVVSDTATLEDRARAVMATRGAVLDADEPVDAAVLAEGLRMPLSPMNEEAAMHILYCSCIMASGTFGSRLSQDLGMLTEAIRRRDAGEHAACMFARQKKLLLNHTLKTLATRLRLDTQKSHMWHKNME
jgi:hypothetical protein